MYLVNDIMKDLDPRDSGRAVAEHELCIVFMASSSQGAHRHL